LQQFQCHLQNGRVAPLEIPNTMANDCTTEKVTVPATLRCKTNALDPIGASSPVAWWQLYFTRMLHWAWRQLCIQSVDIESMNQFFCFYAIQFFKMIHYDSEASTWSRWGYDIVENSQLCNTGLLLVIFIWKLPDAFLLLLSRDILRC